MGWFEDQLRQRAESDQQILEDAFFSMASVVMDKWKAQRAEDQRLVVREALDEILKYYHQKPAEIPEDIRDPARQMEYALRPSGLMTREADLEEGWQGDAFGPMLGYIRDSQTAVALIPGKLGGYVFRDPETGRNRRVTRKNAKMFARQVLCFYQPMPMKKLGIPDLMLYMKRCISRADWILIVIFTLLVHVVGMLEPRIYSLVTGKVLQGRNLNVLYGAAVFLVSSAFAGQMLSVVQQLLMERINTKTSLAVEASMMMRLLSLPVSFFRRFASGDLASRAGAVNSLCEMLLQNIVSVGLSSLLSLVYVTQIFSFAPALVWPSLLVILATVAISVTASLVQIRITRDKMKLEAEESGMNFAVLSGIQKIRLSGAEKRSFARWSRLYARVARLEYNPPTFLKVNQVLVTAVSLIGTLVLYALAIENRIEPNHYYAFMNAYGHVNSAFAALAGIAISVAAIPPVLEMAEPILQAEPEVSEKREAVTGISGSIEISHVSFRYEENRNYILTDMNLKIASGEYVAIVGRTGCGKSTLVRLMLGFEQPETGSIFYDHHDLSKIDPRSLRKHIGVVIQNGSLFQGDIYSNIAISAPELTLEEAWQAAETAGIAEDIRRMPMGMQTIIAEGQGGISGGQKQRLMIARAIAPKPKILIFDEATSALDNKTQKQVSDALDKLHCTRVVIAHRLSTIRNCDRILMMDQGKIIEEGTYEELIRKQGAFADMVARQRLDTEQAG